jgi:Uma2 family endonuclease
VGLDLYYEPVPVPRGAVTFPLSLRLPEGFRPDDPMTWPKVPGRFEFVEGRLLFMPPCGDIQGRVAVDVVFVLREWTQTRSEFVIGGNEAGMLLGGEIRGADAAVWRARDVPTPASGFSRASPILAVEVAGEDENEDTLQNKARWYLQHGVVAVWLVLPESREAIVVQTSGQTRHRSGERLRPLAELPSLDVAVERFFRQLP